MKKYVVLSVSVGIIVSLIFSAWLLNAQFANFQTRINSLVTAVDSLQGQNTELNKQTSELESQISSLENQNSMLQNQTDSLEIQNNLLVNQLGNLTEQLALARPIQVEILSLMHSEKWSPAANIYYSYPFNATIRNNDVVTLGGLTLTVDAYSGNELVGSTKASPFSKINLLNAGEQRLIYDDMYVVFGTPSNLTYVATLKSGDVVLDEFTHS